MIEEPQFKNGVRGVSERSRGEGCQRAASSVRLCHSVPPRVMAVYLLALIFDCLLPCLLACSLSIPKRPKRRPSNGHQGQMLGSRAGAGLPERSKMASRLERGKAIASVGTAIERNEGTGLWLIRSGCSINFWTNELR
mmetsp:Transcript_5636/g.11549  ORF Transcript_5636/g.11549 Transcript_5636/m.11549 type:complete len:138 (+) Transcript_5636:87-500(+)